LAKRNPKKHFFYTILENKNKNKNPTSKILLEKKWRERNLEQASMA
jgi:hypothetical protein